MWLAKVANGGEKWEFACWNAVESFVDSGEEQVVRGNLCYDFWQ